MLSVNLTIAGWPVLVVGGGRVGRRKAVAAVAAGATVTVVDPHTDSLTLPAGVQHISQAFEDSHLDGVRLAFACATPDVKSSPRRERAASKLSVCAVVTEVALSVAMSAAPGIAAGFVPPPTTVDQFATSPQEEATPPTPSQYRMAALADVPTARSAAMLVVSARRCEASVDVSVRVVFMCGGLVRRVSVFVV